MRNPIIKLLLLAILLANTPFTNAQKKTNLSLDPQKAEWFKNAKFGIFVHWGLYSMLEGKYKDVILTPEVDKERFPNGQTWYAEWIQMRLDIPNSEYHPLAKNFNPTEFDADAWIREVKNAGAHYFVITSKHHDGFALWDSKVSEFDIMNTPYKKDILRQLVDACKKYGIKYGFYYSHWQDWEHPQGALPEWHEQRSDAEFEIYWRKKALPQVKELIDMFDPDLFWFDTWGTEGVHITEKRRDELISLVRENSDKCLINGRIAFSNPGENIDFLELLDNKYPEAMLEKPWQTPATMVHSWGWHAYDYNWKSAAKMLGYLANNTSKGGNYLLNIGPKPDGTFPTAATRRLREMGAWLYANGEAIYGANPVKVEVDKGIYLTQKTENGKHYGYITLDKPNNVIYLPIDASKVKSCYTLEANMPIEFNATKGMMRLEIPELITSENNLTVIKMELSSPL